jgi:hypothetical protein
MGPFQCESHKREHGRDRATGCADANDVSEREVGLPQLLLIYPFNQYIVYLNGGVDRRQFVEGRAQRLRDTHVNALTHAAMYSVVVVW